ncbi:TPA: phosphatidylserine decarboxylase [Xanthomonas vasicola pv. zeae]|uniref:Phosphatidylserine decarboxylase n=1 Tax=Xanthomonas vasicola pv. vasculorum TaxID=325776 RepID=A0AAE8F4D3_XANVA|nr:phosphatidylserine decarboxylase [Xanthomonas vasicola pv. vasculorum]AZR35403.1 phosphatidylserine decarboxylase [Xanthomonas vasicola]HHZ21367.1 phosphatidylserine decarboxylase [Xanthomonas vasicola pv. zeae]AZM71742.1 phosphatidylserine decarboxylase [Xanthomonas vasicola pv. vasculorum]OWF64345.1 phosphatidylserine decarboxylase [Xanthomonas vasicola pv. vasculorum]
MQSGVVRLNYGSTVLLPPGVAKLDGRPAAETSVRLGQALPRWQMR